MIPTSMLVAMSLLGAPASDSPEVQRPAVPDPAPAPPDAPAEESPPAREDAPNETEAEPEIGEREPQGPTAVEAPQEAEVAVPTKPTVQNERGGPQEKDGPPFYDDSDLAKLRTHHGLDAKPPKTARTARWKCLIADPTCGFNFEINATSAYALRVRDESVENDDVERWNSARAQYDLWLNFPAVVESLGNFKYTRMTMGPKGGLIASDNEMWGNVGLATRYWLGRGRWAPTLEFSSALTFRVLHRRTSNLLPDETAKFAATRAPVGFHADVGFGIGGFGAIVIGGQYDSPLAREEIPEASRVLTSGMFYVGFRGNIVWGVPAATAVTSHALAQRLACPDSRKNNNGDCP